MNQNDMPAAREQVQQILRHIAAIRRELLQHGLRNRSRVWNGVAAQ